MKQETDNEEWIPNRDSGYQLPAPSASLREKILGEAHSAWEEDMQAPESLPWMLPALRLAASITIAALLVIFAHMGDHYSLARWQSSNQSPSNPQITDSSTQLSMLHPELMRIRKVAASSIQPREAKDLMIYLQRLQNTADGADSNRKIKRHHSTEIFLNPRLRNHLLNPTEILES